MLTLCTKTFSPSRLSLPWKPSPAALASSGTKPVLTTAVQCVPAQPVPASHPCPRGCCLSTLRAVHRSRKAKSKQWLHIKPSSWRTGSRTAAVTSSSSSFPLNRRKENWNTNQVPFYKINSFHLLLFRVCFHSVITQKDTTYCMVLLISKPHSCTGRPAGSSERGILKKVCSLIPRFLWSLFWFGVITWMSLW